MKYEQTDTHPKEQAFSWKIITLSIWNWEKKGRREEKEKNPIFLALFIRLVRSALLHPNHCSFVDDSKSIENSLVKKKRPHIPRTHGQIAAFPRHTRLSAECVGWLKPINLSAAVPNTFSTNSEVWPYHSTLFAWLKVNKGSGVNDVAWKRWMEGTRCWKKEGREKIQRIERRENEGYGCV